MEKMEIQMYFIKIELFIVLFKKDIFHILVDLNMKKHLKLNEKCIFMIAEI